MTDDNHAVRLSEDGPVAWSSLNHTASRDDPFIRGLSQEYAEFLVENWGFEHVDADEARPEQRISDTVEDVLAGTLDDLENALESGEFDDRLEALEEHEAENKDREGAHERIADRREALEDENETDEEPDSAEDES